MASSGPCCHRAAAMADPVCRAPARHCRQLLGRCARPRWRRWRGDRSRDCWPVLDRFARVAIPVVGVLVLTGLVLAVVQLETLGALIETRYGMILSVKLALVVILLSLAALNRFRLTPAIASDPGNTRPLWAIDPGRMGRGGGYSGRRRRLAVYAAAAHAGCCGRRRSPSISTPRTRCSRSWFRRAVVGGDSFVLQLMNGDSSRLAAKEATLILSLPERGIEPIERPAALGRTDIGTRRCAASLSRPLARADRGAGDGFPENRAGRRYWMSRRNESCARFRSERSTPPVPTLNGRLLRV